MNDSVEFTASRKALEDYIKEHVDVVARHAEAELDAVEVQEFGGDKHYLMNATITISMTVPAHMIMKAEVKNNHVG